MMRLLAETISVFIIHPDVETPFLIDYTACQSLICLCTGQQDHFATPKKRLATPFGVPTPSLRTTALRETPGLILHHIIIALHPSHHELTTDGWEGSVCINV